MAVVERTADEDKRLAWRGLAKDVAFMAATTKQPTGAGRSRLKAHYVSKHTGWKSAGSENAKTSATPGRAHS